MYLWLFGGGVIAKLGTIDCDNRFLDQGDHDLIGGQPWRSLGQYEWGYQGNTLPYTGLTGRFGTGSHDI